MKGIAGVLLVSAAVQIAIAAQPDTMGDLLTYRGWMRHLATDGVIASYWPDRPPASDFDPPVDYPPVIPYILLLIGRAAAAVDPAVLHGSTRLIDFLIRVPFVASNILLSIVIFTALRRRTDAAAATFATALLALNPAIIFHTAYWGQTDAFWTLFIVTAVILVGEGKPEWAWAAVTVGVLSKPLAAPFAPLIAIATLVRFGWKRTLVSAAVAGVTTLALISPFLRARLLERFLRTSLLQLDAMPFISVNAHNLWWLVGGGLPWTLAADRVFGLVSYETVGLLLFGVWYVVCLIMLVRKDGRVSLELVAASVAFGFFMLSTHMHENHLFGFLPLLILARGEHPRWRRFEVLVTVTFLLNMALHDPYLLYALKPYSPGPRLLLQARSVSVDWPAAHFMSIGYPQLVEEMRGEKSLLWVVLTLLNSQANVLLFAYWVWSLRPVRVGGEISWKKSRRVIVVGVLFLVLTAVPFLARAARAPRWPSRYSSIQLAELPPPEPESAEYGLEGVRRSGVDLAAHPPSGARFVIHTDRRPLRLFFVPSFYQNVPVDQTDGVTFEVRAGSVLLYKRHVIPSEHLSAVSVDVPGAQDVEDASVSFVTTAGPGGNRDFDWAIWHDVVFVLGDPIVRQPLAR